MTHSFLLVLLAFALGIVNGILFPFGLPINIWLLVICFGLLVVGRKSNEVTFAPNLILITLIIGSFLLGSLRSEIASNHFGNSILASSVNQPVELVGVVSQEPSQRERTTHLYVEVGPDLLLVTTDRYQDINYGDEIKFSGTLKKPESFVTDLGREFNYPQYLLARGVEYQVSFAVIEVQEKGKGNPLISFLLTQKQKLISGINSVIEEPQAGLGLGLLLGVKQALGEELEEAFRATGIIHIVVLSGYNVMLVVAFMLYILAFFTNRKWQAIFGIVAICSFAFLVGLSATVVRASIMAGLLLVAHALNRTYDVWRALLLAGAVMLVINPYLLLYDVGFQFSFIATVGLLLFIPNFEATTVTSPHLIRLRDYFWATVATQVAVLPLLLYHIGEVSLIAVMVNVLVLPAVPVAMFLTFFSGVIALFSVSLALPVGFLAQLVLMYITETAKFLSTVPFATVTIPTFPISGVLILYLFLIVGYYRWQRRQASSDTMAGWTIEEEIEGKIRNI